MKTSTPLALIVFLTTQCLLSSLFAQQTIVPSKEIEPGIEVFGATNQFTKLMAYQSAALSNDEKLIIAGNRKLQKFNIETGEFELMSEEEFPVQAIAFNGDRKRMFALRAEEVYSWINANGQVEQPKGNKNRSILEVYDAETFELAKRIEIEGGGRTKMQLSPSGKLVALQDRETIVVMDIATEEILATAETNSSGFVGGAAFVANETCLIYPKNYIIAGIDVGTGDQLAKQDFKAIGQSCYMINGASCGKLFAAGASGKVTFYDTDRGEKLSDVSLDSNGSIPAKSQFSEDGKYYAFSHWDNESSSFIVQVADSNEGKLAKTFANTNSSSLAFSKDGRQLYIFNRVNGLEKKVVVEEKGVDSEGRFRSAISKFATNPNSSQLLLGSSFGWTLFDPESGQLLVHVDTSYSGTGALIEPGKFFWPNSTQNKVQLMRTQVKDNGAIKTSKSHLGTSGSVPPTATSLFKSFMSSGSRTNSYQNYKVHGMSRSVDRDHFYVLLGKSYYDLEPDENGVYRYKVRKGTFQVQQRDLDGALIEKSYSANMDQLGVSLQQNFPSSRTAISPTGNRLSVLGNLIDLDNMKELYKAKNSYRTKFSPDGKWCLFSLRDQIEVVDAETGAVVDTLPFVAGTFFEFSQNSKYLVIGTGGAKEEIKVFESGRWSSPVFQRKGTQANRSALGLSHDGTKIYIGLIDTRLEIWDWKKL